MGKCKALSEFDRGLIVMARQLGQTISKEVQVVNQQQGHGPPRLRATQLATVAHVYQTHKTATEEQNLKKLL